MANNTDKPTNIPWAWIKCVREITDIGIDKYRSISLPVEIVPWLLLSDEMSVRNTSKLKDLGVTHVLTVNGMPAHQADWLNDKIETAGIVHKYVRGEDREGYDMIGKHWDECRSYLDAVRNNGGRVVVHCAAGINRSGLIVCAAQMYFERQNVIDVVRHCVDRRFLILSNVSFQKQLCLLAAKEGLLGEKPEGFTDDDIAVIPLPPPPRQALESLFLPSSEQPSSWLRIPFMHKYK
mmetsp:Transcript_8107/g.10894  ORF Transcript_8107/g.10894 Transcript_8107/m.10894 type:complete len:236 (+) Transcript_8107:71-778(+)